MYPVENKFPQSNTPNYKMESVPEPFDVSKIEQVHDLKTYLLDQPTEIKGRVIRHLREFFAQEAEEEVARKQMSMYDLENQIKERHAFKDFLRF